MPKPAPKRRKKAARTPVQRRSLATRAAILKAAAQLLGRRGYARTNTNDIARRAGVSVGSVYEYFRDKDAIVQALLEAHLGAGEQLFAERALVLSRNAAARPLRELLAGVVESLLLFHADDPRLHRVLSSAAVRDRASARVDALEERAVQVLTALLSSHPEARVQRPELAARIVVQTADALAHRWIIEPSGEPVPVARLSAELTRMLPAYLTA